MNAQQLKNSILQEAIEGRLVPQDPNDEPASVLLEKIQSEKKRLVKEGKLKKKDLEETPISEDEIPFKIPESWEWVRLGAHISSTTGLAYKKDDLAIYSNEHVRVLRGGNISFGSWCIKDDDVMIGKQFVNDELMLKRGMFISPAVTSLEHMGKTALIREDQKNVVAGGFVLMLIPHFNNETYWEYLNIFFQSGYYREKCKSITNKSGQAFFNLSRAKLLNLLVPLPPLAEQKRIVEKIEELLPKVEEYGKAQENLDKLNEELPERLKKSILQEAIEGRLVPQDPNDEPASVLLEKIRAEKKKLVKEGKLKKKDLEEVPISEDEIPFKIPESWEWVRLKSIANKIVDGDHNPPRGLSNDTGYYMLSSKNINKNSITDLDSVRFLSYGDWEKCNERTKLQKGDILLTIVGTLGRSTVNKSDKPYCFQRSVSVIQTFVFNYFLKYSFDSPYFQSMIDDKSTGTAQRGFYLKQLENAIILLPPLAEQKRIVEKIEQLIHEIDKLK